jgi:hypothetical protein
MWRTGTDAECWVLVTGCDPAHFWEALLAQREVDPVELGLERPAREVWKLQANALDVRLDDVDRHAPAGLQQGLRAENAVQLQPRDQDASCRMCAAWLDSLPLC